MGAVDLIKSILKFVDFDTWKKEDYKPFKKLVTDKIESYEKLNARLEEQEKILGMDNLNKLLNANNHLIDLVYGRIIEDFKKFHHNERNFNSFLKIQVKSIDKYWGEDLEKIMLENGINMKLLNFVEECMKDPIIWIKKELTPEIKEIFEKYDKPDRKDYIESLLLDYAEQLKIKFYESFKEKRYLIRNFG